MLASILASLRRNYQKSRLKDKSFSFLYEPPHTGEFVSFDCETTGLNPKKDEILSIGAVKISDGIIRSSEKFEVFLKPKSEIARESIKIHHIRNRDLEGALEPREAIEAFLRFIENRPLVGYYLEFDVAMINKYMRMFFGSTLANEQHEVSAMYFDAKNDPFGGRNVDLRFESIMKDLDLPVFMQHSAYYDALMTALIFVKLKKVRLLS